MKTHEPSPSRNQRPLHVVLYHWAVVIFVLGLTSSGLIYLVAGDGTSDSSRQLTGGKMYQHNVRLMGGKTALYATRFNEWFVDLWHGRQLAYTVAVIAALIAAGLLLFGLLISGPPSDETDRGPG